ncbi:hypothetical protein [Paraflavitalea speifideaquila]|uniref:hypothetical protein n=1 Tax=Paraflavitalea speifideaquila TaxID=3076558 RepID=UPI0028EF512E|nr:hypothetical protein [Paraflavitalea speifideiaquila]
MRKKSRLTREKVLKDPAFANTRFHAQRLVTASKIASSIYRSLPIHWRQFWMYRDFTGIAISMIAKGATPQQTDDYLWKTYAEYWVLYQQATGIKLETGPKKQPSRRRKNYTTRIKHRNSNPKRRRYSRILGLNHWKSNYNNATELMEKERKHIARQKKREWLEKQSLIGHYKEQEQHRQITKPNESAIQTAA